MADITLLDGGMGQELVARSGRAPTPLWATQVMLDQPELVQQIHADYFAAGATVATTNTYAIHHDRLVKQGMDYLFHDLHAAALRLAKAARAAHGSGRIAGSLGPLGASYRADVAEPADQAASKYAEIAALLAPEVDFFLIETSASVLQSTGALQGAVTAGKPVWLSITVDDADGTRLRSGEAVADLAPVIAEFDPAAVLVNCSVPEAMAAALTEVATFGRPFGAYANGFTHIAPDFLKDSPTVAALSSRHDLTPERYARFAMDWVGQGATIIGGCCEVGPVHIAALAQSLRAAGHRIV
ncbi:homocysteine S-methyltransferase family protein [Pseudorhodobacter sp. E13]|uniref:homocysteine S-methyltransferase family protein n=1 Tax=Pseudorhodobacter sp. E13 TaxID=2487931 RepID=UPI000F8E000A|nr:homocysteine S-methyltransferase family protein [Pseudorhodobacter sp. E13]RUS61059.1 homocysteine S-methyltransferase family protein [Pseudorhodobacter sp. E13]